MKYELINELNNKYNTKQQILINRGIKEEDLVHYMNLTDEDINAPDCFGNDLLFSSATCLKAVIDAEEDICEIVDCDCDGYTSSATATNYLYDLNPDYVLNHVHWFMHEGKQHGLQDAMDWIFDINPSLVIIPDAGSNDIAYIEELYNHGIKVIILDHHELEVEPSPHCFLINSQSPEYLNHELSGVGVVYQFCKYLDKFYGVDYADWYLDLVALGNIGDMMSLRSFETRRLIEKGIQPSAIHNPFIYEMWRKNKFKLGDEPTPWGFTFYIVPFVNAITRSGTLEEKELIFESMLKFKAFNEIPSNKRGHRIGEMERLVDQAIRTCTNVKNRQGRSEEAGIELVKNFIEENHMMDHKVLLFLLEPGQIKTEIRGLIANKLMARYQRPCCMLTKVIDKNGKISYQGSARGCDKVGVTEFKDICAATQVTDYVAGHQGAFGLGLPAEEIDEFVRSTDEQLKDMPNEPLYYVDYIWSPSSADGQAIIDIADMAPYWGKDMDESLVAIEGVKVTKNNIAMMKSNTCKITLPNGIAMIKFRMPDEEFDKLYSENGYVEINVVGKCNRNEWCGNVSGQILIEDYEIVGGCAYVF